MSKAVLEMHQITYSGLYRRYRMHDFEMPVVHYVDNPRQIQRILGDEPAVCLSL